MSMTPAQLRERLYRSSTFEGMADAAGVPGKAYYDLYESLARQGVTNIITGCTYVSQEGKMVQPGQAGIDTDAHIDSYLQVADRVHELGSRIYMQISHAGRQTSSLVTGEQVVGASEKGSPYFRSRPKRLSISEIDAIIESYAKASLRAKQAGFDGVQIHAAHGYLVHQFLHPGINDRQDEYGVDPETGIGALFLRRVIRSVRDHCGDNFPILIKISGGDDLRQPFSQKDYIELIKMLDKEKLFAIEISYGTMENALNIFRGESIPGEAVLNFNFRYKTTNPLIRKLWKPVIAPLLSRSIKKISPCYNLEYAILAKRQTNTPVICVGGFRTGEDIRRVLESGEADYVSLCRPFICEPDLIERISTDRGYVSKCVNCNICAIMCDSGFPTRCYKITKHKGAADANDR